MQEGYIKIHRKFIRWYGFSSSKRVHLWITLLMKANHKENKFLFNGKPTVIQRGSFVTGTRKLSVETGISHSYIHKLLKEFESEGMLKQAANNLNRLITITSWDDYQVNETQKEHKGNTKETQKEPNKNVKNVKNEKNYAIFESLWNRYPRKDGKKEALKYYQTSVKTDSDINSIETALEKYNIYVKSNKIEEKYIKKGSTWFNNWQDWIDYKESVVTKKEHILGE